MTTIQSPSHALGLMAIEYYNKIGHVLLECMTSPDGPRKIYPLILGLDAMLYSYRDKMHYTHWDEKQQKPVQVKYWDTIKNLNQRAEKLHFGMTKDSREWAEWFHEYLSLLSSVFNQIGLAPAKRRDEREEEEEDDTPYYANEPRTNKPQANPNVPNQNLQPSA